MPAGGVVTQKVPALNAALDAVDQFSRQGDFIAAADAAESALAAFPNDLRLAYQGTLALARAGATDTAHARYNTLQLAERASEEPSLRLDILALQARLEKDRARTGNASLRAAALSRAFTLYARLSDIDADPYPAINAATLALLRRDPESADAYARLALEKLDIAKGYWRAAIAAEAHLIMKDENAARLAIERAAEHPPDLAARASTLRQLTDVIRAQGLSEALLDPLRPGATIHFTGNRFAENSPTEAMLRDKTLAFIDEKRVAFAYGSLASGADIVMAEAILERGARFHAFLPFSKEEFVSISVRPMGESWVPRFERCLAAAASIRFSTTEAYLGDDLLFGYNGRFAMGMALLNAQNCVGPVYQLAASDERGVKNEVAGTVADVSAWAGTGRPTETIVLPARRDPQDRTYSRTTPERIVRAMLFGDVKGFSKLPESILPAFNDVVLERFARTFERFDARLDYVNTWGDGIYATFRDADTAASCALLLQEDMRGLAESGFPENIGLRMGAHVGPVFPIVDPVTKRPGFTGNHVSPNGTYRADHPGRSGLR